MRSLDPLLHRSRGFARSTAGRHGSILVSGRPVVCRFLDHRTAIFRRVGVTIKRHPQLIDLFDDRPQDILMGGLKTPSFRQAERYWYHWFMATKRGAEAIHDDPHGFARIQWENWGPDGWFDEATFASVSKSFDNPDWVAVTLHSYRVRWGEAEPDPQSAWRDPSRQRNYALAMISWTSS